MTTTSPVEQDNSTVQPQPASSSPSPSPSPAPTQIHHQAYSGPIPPPSILEQYNEIIPDAAERIIRMTEKNKNQTGKQRNRQYTSFSIDTGRPGMMRERIRGAAGTQSCC